MKVALLYFTGTGCTGKFATEIKKGFDQLGFSVDLLRIKQGVKVNPSNYEIVGVGAPAYSFRAPRLVTNFLRRANFENKPYFVFCTSGGMPGNTLWNLYKAISKTSKNCLGYTDASGITNLRSWMPSISESKPYLGGLSNYDLSYTSEFAREIIKRLDIKQKDKSKQSRNWIPPFIFGTIVWSLLFTWRWQMLLTVGIKRVDKSKCTSCQLCATKICPSSAISMNKNNRPRFNEFLCVGCNGCVNLCPEDAIWTYQTRNHHQYTLYEEYL